MSVTGVTRSLRFFVWLELRSLHDEKSRQNVYEYLERLDSHYICCDNSISTVPSTPLHSEKTECDITRDSLTRLTQGAIL